MVDKQSEISGRKIVAWVKQQILRDDRTVEEWYISITVLWGSEKFFPS
jgi:hypothetical protein